VRVIVSTVTSRRDWVTYLASHIPELEAVEDTHQRGGWRNFAACLEHAGDDGYLHLEDDVTLTVDFLTKVGEAIPDPRIPVNFFSLIDFRKPQMRNARSFMMTQAWWCPPGHARRLLAFLPMWQVHGRKGWVNNGRKHWDLAMGDFWGNNRLNYWQAVPSLVQHRPSGSILGHPGGRLSPTFVDPELTNHPHPELFT
jgi:hypothetical protein